VFTELDAGFFEGVPGNAVCRSHVGEFHQASEQVSSDYTHQDSQCVPHIIYTMDSDEDSDAAGSWISFKSLKKAADVKASFRTKPQLSPSVSGYTSINSEAVANPAIHSSISFSNLHKKYEDSEIAKDRGGRSGQLTQAQARLIELQQQQRSQEVHWKKQFQDLELRIQSKERGVEASPYRDGGRTSARLATERMVERDHSACVAEAADLKLTVERQQQVIDGLEKTIETLQRKLQEIQPVGKPKRRHHLSVVQ